MRTRFSISKKIISTVMVVCLLGTFVYQPQFAYAKMVNKSEASQNIDLEAYKPSQQEAQQLEELRAGGESDGGSAVITIVAVVIVIGLVYIGWYAIANDKHYDETGTNL